MNDFALSPDIFNVSKSFKTLLYLWKFFTSSYEMHLAFEF